MTVVPFPTSVIPGLPDLNLSEQEKALISELQMLKVARQWDLRMSEAYYLGDQRIQNLRIAVPQELEFLRTIVGWPKLAVDPYVETLGIDGFRLPDATDVDRRLGEMWALNALDGELPLATTDALSLGHVYWLVGSPEEPGLPPRVTVESPLNLVAKWDLRGTSPTAAWQTYWAEDRNHATLLLPGQTIVLATDDNGAWQIVDRDKHDFDFVPLVRMANQPRTNARDGRSAITPTIRSITDSGCRDLISLEVSREFYSTPKVTILGASEAAFQNSDGTPKTAWETLISKYNAIEADSNGNVPKIHQLTAYDPSVLIKPLEFRAAQMAAEVCAPPQELGLYTQGNPTSADAYEQQARRRANRRRLMQATFGAKITDVMQMMVRFQNGGVLPAEFRRLEVDWHQVDNSVSLNDSQAVQFQVASGSVPAESDVVLKKLGYTAVERAQLAQDREAAKDAQAAQQIIAAVNGQTAPQAGQQADQEPSQEPSDVDTNG